MKQFDHSKIKEFREAAGLSQDKLAAMMSTPDERIWTQQLSGWECGRGGITVRSLAKICSALNRNADDFLVDTGNIRNNGNNSN